MAIIIKRPRINKFTGLPVRTDKEMYLMKKELCITPKENRYRKMCRQMSAIN